jgi:ERCC4-related helicase
MPREGEVPGFTYEYVPVDLLDLLKASNALSDHTVFNGTRYGARRTNWNTKKVFIMTPSVLHNMTASDRKESHVVYLDIAE